MKIHSPDIINSIALNGNEGVAGQIITSAGPGAQAIWSTPATLAPLYLYTDKAVQVIGLGPADVTWNSPAADAVNGITFNGTTGFTLTANRLYKLTTNITPTVAALAYSLSWVDSANNPVGSLNQPANGLANLEHIHGFAIFKPLTNTTVKVRLTTAVGLTLGTICSVFIETVD